MSPRRTITDEQVDLIVDTWMRVKLGIEPGPLTERISTDTVGVGYIQAMKAYIPRFLKDMTEQQLRAFYESGGDWRRHQALSAPPPSVMYVDSQALVECQRRITELETTIHNVIDLKLVTSEGAKLLKRALGV